MNFKVDDVVWAHLKGYSSWPGKIVDLSSSQAKVYWFADYRESLVPKSKLESFEKNIQKYKAAINSKPMLKKAAEEASIFLVQKKSVT